MSSNCMYILRNVQEQASLRSKLISLAKIQKCGICCDPENGLLAMKTVRLNPHDVAFEVCDSFGSNVAELLLSYEGDIINGEQALLPLFQRLQILQDIAVTCVPHTEILEIYLGDNNPYLPDYSNYRIACTDVADTLYREYQTDIYTRFTPCVHLIIETQRTAEEKTQRPVLHPNRSNI